MKKKVKLEKKSKIGKKIGKINQTLICNIEKTLIGKIEKKVYLHIDIVVIMVYKNQYEITVYISVQELIVERRFWVRQTNIHLNHP